MSKKIFCFLLALQFLFPGCGYKAAYIKDSENVGNERWKIESMDTGLLSNDERNVYEAHGKPEFIRFFREVGTREKVYEWVYTNPSHLFWFVNGKRVNYVAVDTDTSPFTRKGRKTFKTSTIAVLITSGVLAIFHRLVIAKKGL